MTHLQTQETRINQVVLNNARTGSERYGSNAEMICSGVDVKLSVAYRSYSGTTLGAALAVCVHPDTIPNHMIYADKQSPLDKVLDIDTIILEFESLVDEIHQFEEQFPDLIVNTSLPYFSQNNNNNNNNNK
ncbi:hypothetical protein DLAC_10485 [Tieghemostelium lacteum]|uniref:Uncharacterized protein n=1 Tax=Tieghemostelium lacteum TaxID=361077 RepID=A0A151Z529_TIELA|nr:hypothetical protein DLAC_10485 [Tieghemostelium lacteum]|eukprot:KYQ88904.1 hypothetical protein DLAC_10485 [Tieghemostelium lacteum]